MTPRHLKNYSDETFAGSDQVFEKPDEGTSKMTLDEFRESLIATAPPAGLTHALAALWWDGKGDWKRAQQRKGQ